MAGKPLLAALLLLTLGTKIAFSREPPPADAALFGATVEGMLRQSGFETGRRGHALGIIVYGRAGGCGLMIAEQDPRGTFTELLAVFGRPFGPLRYVWRGEILDTVPRAATVEYYVQREFRRVGGAPERHPIFAVAASPDCALDRLPWTRIAALPR
jgi:hypothetical protein